jgi:hypothetical protein
MSWPLGRAPEAGPLTMADVAAQAAPGTYPVPAGRGRWRLTVHARQFADTSASGTILAELNTARSRRLDQAWSTPATLTFAIDGHSPAAALITELQTDVMAWRWDDQTGQDVAVFRGIVTQSQDEISEQVHTVTFTCHDYIAMLSRRMFTGTGWAVTQVDQDYIAMNLIYFATNRAQTSAGVTLYPGSYLPLTPYMVNPDGTQRAQGSSGTLRDRTYPAQTFIFDAFDELSKVIGGFDYDVRPNQGNFGPDVLRIWFPYQGVVRSDVALIYGSTVASLTRSVDSADYANFQRVLGNNGSSDPAAPQLFAEAVNADANNVGVTPVGLWMAGDNQADVTIQSTLNETAQGNLALSGVLVPTYSLALRPGAYAWGAPNMGDVVPLVIQSGRLNVNTTVRVLGISYDIGDDGQEDVSLTVGRPAVQFRDLLAVSTRDVNALTRR